MAPYPLTHARMFHIRFRNPNKPGRDVDLDEKGRGASRPPPTWEAYDEGKKYLELGMIADELAEFVKREVLYMQANRGINGMHKCKLMQISWQNTPVVDLGWVEFNLVLSTILPDTGASLKGYGPGLVNVR